MGAILAVTVVQAQRRAVTCVEGFPRGGRVGCACRCGGGVRRTMLRRGKIDDYFVAFIAQLLAFYWCIFGCDLALKFPDAPNHLELYNSHDWNLCRALSLIECQKETLMATLRELQIPNVVSREEEEVSPLVFWIVSWHLLKMPSFGVDAPHNEKRSSSLGL